MKSFFKKISIVVVIGFFSWMPLALHASNTVTLIVNDCVDPTNCNNTSTTTVTNVPTNTQVNSLGTTNGLHPLYVNSIQVQQKQTSVTIAWVTSTDSISTFSWGTTTDYSAGVSGETSNRHNHAVTLKSLLPNTRYYFRIDISDVYGNKLMYVASFVTAQIDQHAPPPNIAKPTINLQNDGLHISWINPRTPDFNGVRIVRSEYTYPKNPNDGEVVYEGKGSKTIDPIINLNIPYYYAIFSTNTAGEYSSGTLFNLNAQPETPIPGLPTNPQKISLSFSNLIFIQDGSVVPISSSTVTVDANKKVVILLPHENVPAQLDIAYLSLGTSTSRTLYGLKDSEIDGAYETTIDVFSIYPGVYPVVITGITASNTVYEIVGNMTIQHPEVDNNFYIQAFRIVMIINILAAILLIILTILHYLHRNLTKKDTP